MMLTGEYRKPAAISKPFGKPGINLSTTESFRRQFVMPTNNSMPQAKARLPGLDYLRGLAAFGIMVYHYSSWSFGEQAASSFLGRVGIYGVAIFYILSGQTLSYIYSSKLQLTTTELREFYNKRFFRIFPLLWLATLFSIAISKHIPNGIDLLLNLTGLFGLFKWDTYFATGAWSIGNELCFYIAFPLLVYLIKKFKRGFFLVLVSAFGISGYFAFNRLYSNLPLSAQWHTYTNPLNQFLFFLGGVAIGNFISPPRMKGWLSLILGLIGFTAFVLIPIQGNAIALVTGSNRLFFTSSCFLICYSFFSLVHTSSPVDKPLLMLGQASYSLYLLHPLVYAFTKAFFSKFVKIFHISNINLLYTSIIISLLVSYLSYQYFERFFIKFNQKRQEPI
ncbi:acyltransferase family protein [Hymenobacter terrigena]